MVPELSPRLRLVGQGSSEYSLKIPDTLLPQPIEVPWVLPSYTS